MAEYTIIPTTLSEVGALVAALADLGMPEVEVHAERSEVLRDQSGHAQNQSAMLIVRYQTSGASADLGFRRSIGGPFLFVVPKSDSSRFNGAWLRQLSQRYRYHLASDKLQERGFVLVKPSEVASDANSNLIQADQSRVKRLQPQGFWGNLLHRIVPDWTARHTVEILAHSPQNPRAARTLAEVVVHFDHAPSRELAYQALQRLTDQRCIDQVCEVWASVRQADLAQLLIEQGWVASTPVAVRVLTALKTERVEYLSHLNSKDLALLLQCCEDIDPAIAEGAQAYLRELQSPVLLDALCEIWTQGRDHFLWELLQTKKYLPRRSTRTRVLIALKLEMEESIVSGRPNVIEPLVEACSDSDHTIAEASRRVLAQLKQAETQQALCDLIIEREVPQAEKVVLEAGYLPKEAYKKALFFFVTEQWERYEGLDFDLSLVRTAYQNADPALKRRLAEKVRKAGRADYLKIVAGYDYRTRATVLSPEEAELTVQILTANREWNKLWPLVFEVGLELSVQVLKTLLQAGWQAEREDDRLVFEQLKPLVANGRVDQYSGRSFQQLLPLAVFRARARATGRVNSLAFSPSRPVIAIGTGTGRVILWNMSKAEREGVLSGFEHSIGKLAFTSEAALVCAERTNSETDPCKLYLWPGEGTNVIPLGQHAGSVKVLQAVGRTGMLSAGRDGKVKLWDIAERSLKKSLDLEDWPRAECITEDGKQLALWQERWISFVKLPELEQTNRFYIGSIGVTRSAIFAPGGETLLAGKFSGGLGVCLSKGQNWRALSVVPGSLGEIVGQVQGLAVLPGRPVVLAATTEGIIRFLEWSKTPRLLGSVQAPTTRLTSLTISADGAFMAVGDPDASFSLWDLRVLELGQLFEQPLAKATSRQLAALTALLESGAELPASLKELLLYAQFILRHRLRFAIELSEEFPTIQAGDFDIEIEG